MKNYRNSNLTKARGVGSILMAVLYFGMAFIVVQFQEKGLLEINKTLAYFAAGFLVFYAIFRVYRGINILRNAKNEE
ncbi:MAG TPA: hypothetical protein VK027_01775 [Chitinophagaceae bacterium]|nr:hypothetical protein [Chitinophagaceae bacterium]